MNYPIDKLNDELDEVIKITKSKLAAQVSIVMGLYSLCYILGLIVFKIKFSPVIFFVGLILCAGIRYKMSNYCWSLKILDQYNSVINEVIPKALNDVENGFREYSNKAKTCNDIVACFYSFVQLGRMHVTDQRISVLVLLYSELFTELCNILEQIEVTYPDYLGKDEEQMINSMLAFKAHEKAFIEFMNNLVAEIEKEESNKE